MATSSDGSVSSSIKTWVGSGSPWVWLAAGAVSLSLVMVFGVLLLIASNGLRHFWPAAVAQLTFNPGAGEPLLGEIADRESVTAARAREAGGRVPAGATLVDRLLIKRGNRDIGGEDFRWVNVPDIKTIDYPADAYTIERLEWGNLYGRIKALREGRTEVPLAELSARLARAVELRAGIDRLQRVSIGAANYALDAVHRRQKAERKAGTPASSQSALAAEEQALRARYEVLTTELQASITALSRDHLLLETVTGETREVPLAKVVRLYAPNHLSLRERLSHYGAKLWEFISAQPREANTEGGVFPAIFGTVLMVIMMSVFITPLGVITAVYLHEYATPGPVTSVIRIAVNNLAGVPSVVYGVFGFGFFVYLVGGSVDRAFFADALPSPTFGTPGILWSALTLSLLTVPVVIVTTEEGLSRIPRALREGSLALGATKAETLWRMVLPMATPAMMTGLILAVARAAGEVAPLMLVGVVKLAPTLPLDGNFPFLHLERKFMHLGFHIYDVGFQSPNVEAARPLVYCTALLLIILVMSLNLAAIRLRNSLREKYHAAE